MNPFFSFDDDEFFGDLLLMGAAAGGGSVVQETATGNPLTFVTDLARPLKSLLIPFTPQQEGTGDPSPQNIRSILPWNGLTVFGGGKNLLNPVADDWLIREKTYRYINGVIPEGETARFTLEVKDSTVDISGCYLGFVLNDLAESSPTGYKWIIEGGTVKSDMSNLSTGGTQVGQRCSNVFIYPATAETFQKLFSRFNVMVELGNTATAYEPYRPITETDIVFPSAVYGGTLDVVSGVLTVTHEGLVSTWGQAKVDRKQSGYQQGRMFFTHDVPVSGQSGASATNQKCNIAKYQWDDFNGTPHFYTGTLEGRNCAVILIPEDTPDETEIVVSAKLRTTYEIQLTPAQITALIGNNTIWSDADGSMTAVYLKKG